MVVEQGAEGEEAADDVLARVGAIHPQDELSAVALKRPREIRGVLLRGRRGRDPVQGRRVDRNRVVPHLHGPAVDGHGQRVEIGGQVEQVLATADEVAGESQRLEPHHVVAEQATQQRVAHGRWQR